MARDYARLLLSVWDDADWKHLTSTDHDVFAALITSPDLSWCGVVPLLPQRLIEFSADLNLRKVSTALRNLETAGFIVTDDTTGEILIRSYIRHDGVMVIPNIVKAMLKAHAKVRSVRILAAIDDELRRIHDRDPELKGWRVLADEDPHLMPT